MDEYYPTAPEVHDESAPASVVDHLRRVIAVKEATIKRLEAHFTHSQSLYNEALASLHLARAEIKEKDWKLAELQEQLVRINRAMQPLDHLQTFDRSHNDDEADDGEDDEDGENEDDDDDELVRDKYGQMWGVRVIQPKLPRAPTSSRRDLRRVATSAGKHFAGATKHTPPGPTLLQSKGFKKGPFYEAIRTAQELKQLQETHDRMEKLWKTKQEDKAGGVNTYGQLKG